MRRGFGRLILTAAVFVGIGSGPSWAAEWDKVLEAAKREGKVAVIGPQGTETNDALSLGFQKKYPGIRVDVNSMAGNQIAPKLLNELRAAKYTTDLIVTGTTTAIESLLPANAVAPLPPYLVGPNSRDPSVWRGKKFNFADGAGQYNLVMSAYIKAPFIYNPKLVDPREIKSWKDLLNPKWKGKIVLRDPLSAGGGLASATFWYTHKALGKDFVQKLFAQQDIVIGRDDRQILDFVAQGKYPIAIGPSDVLTNELIGRGLSLKHLDSGALQEGTYMTAGNGSIVAVRDAPHPNALKVYLDYLFSKEGQLEWSKAAGFASLRRDVPHDHVLDLLVPKEGVDYPDMSTELYVKLRMELVVFIKPLLRR